MTNTAVVDVSMSLLPRRDADESAGGGNAAPHAAHWLGLAAAPTFALMALWTALVCREADLVCSALHGSGSPGGMTLMYLLMCAFHLAPWLKLLNGR